MHCIAWGGGVKKLTLKILAASVIKQMVLAWDDATVKFNCEKLMRNSPNKLNNLCPDPADS